MSEETASNADPTKGENEQLSSRPASSKTPSQKKARKSGKRAAKKKRGGKTGAVVGAPRPFPAETLQDSLRVPTVIKEFNGGNPWPPSEVAKALGNLGPRGNKFYYLTASSRDYGFTLGTRDAEVISLDSIGRSLLYAPSPDTERQALRNAFFNVPVFKAVFEHYSGENLPDLKYLQNTLESVFNVPPPFHQDFSRIYSANLGFLEQYGIAIESNGDRPRTHQVANTHSIVIGEPKSKSSRVAFVVMPFSEKTDKYPKGFFDEVLRNLVTPAAIEAGFRVETAKKEGSDVIHSTIVNDLLAADLVIADLTDHNPNVLFELGLRMASEKPTALVRAKGTGAIFDVDNLLRVLDYDPNLWKSTIDTDVPRLTNHIKGTWDGHSTAMTYMQILKKRE